MLAYQLHMQGGMFAPYFKLHELLFWNYGPRRRGKEPCHSMPTAHSLGGKPIVI